MPGAVSGWSTCAGRSATLQALAFLEPVNEQGKLVIRIDLPDLDHWEVGEIVGQVVDHEGRPIVGRDLPSPSVTAVAGGASTGRNGPRTAGTISLPVRSPPTF